MSNIPRGRFDTDDEDDDATTQNGVRSKLGIPEMTGVTPVMERLRVPTPPDPLPPPSRVDERRRASPLPVLSDDSSDSLISDHLSVFAEEDDIPDTLVDYDAPAMLEKKQLDRLPIVVDQNRLAEMVRGTPANESGRLPSLTVLAAETRRRKARTQTIGWLVLIASVSFAAFAGGVAFHDARFVRALMSIVH